MADQYITDLPTATQLTDTDALLVNQSGIARMLTGELLRSFVDRNVMNISVVTVESTEPAGVRSFDPDTGTLVLNIPRGASISSFELVGTSGNAKTYRLTLETGDYFDYVLYDGNGIASIAQTGGSSSHPAGTVDTYTITFTNGTTTTFQVRNGEDGDGAPGSATPLAAAGEARVGTSTSFARQDHRHPVTEKKYDLTIPSGEWTQVSGKDAWQKNIFSQISAAGITMNAYTKLDLYAEADTFLQMIEDGVSTIYPVITYSGGSYIPYLYAVGAAPTTAFDVQLIASEVRT